MKEKLQHYFNEQIDLVVKYGSNPTKAFDRAYGALMFVLHEFGYDKEIAYWWDNEISTIFLQLIHEGR